jgi:regulator of ribonuclease activity A
MSFKTPDLLDRQRSQNPGRQRRASSRRCSSNYGGRRAFSGQIVTLKLFEDNSLVREALPRTARAPGAGDRRRGFGALRPGRRPAGHRWRTRTAGQDSSSTAASGIRRTISGIDIGMLALATHPLKSIKKGVGDRDLAVSFGGVTFRPEEWIYVDPDGVVVSDQALD